MRGKRQNKTEHFIECLKWVARARQAMLYRGQMVIQIN